MTKSVEIPISKQIAALAAMFYFEQLFFLQDNQRKHVGIISTNNV